MFRNFKFLTTKNTRISSLILENAILRARPTLGKAFLRQSRAFVPDCEMAGISGNDLIEAGWEPGPEFPAILEAAGKLEERGLSDPDYILKLLERDFPKGDPFLRMREKPIAASEAIEATCPADEKNIEGVRRFMGQLMKTPVIEGGTIMPDACPAGAAEATIPVGGAIAVRNAILPAAHSADICCSMYSSIFTCEKSTSEMLDSLMDSTRFGYGGREGENRVHHPVLEESVWSNSFLQGLEEYAAKHIADQGDGNHFAYLGRLRVTRSFVDALSEAGHDELARPLRDAAGSRLEDPDGVTFYSLVTHHGSRGLGAHVYKRGHKAAIKETAKVAKGIPKAAAWLDYSGENGKEYWEALEYVSRWTKANHQSIHSRFLEQAEASRITEFGNEHNFVWKQDSQDELPLFLHGKGATPAWNDNSGRPFPGLIPLNMAAPILITLGRNNEEFLGFAPHGAGRNLSRTATLRNFRKANGDADDDSIQKAIEESTKGLDIRWYYGKGDLTESPIGYKPAAQVKAQIERFELADIIGEVTPLGCIMAGDSGPKPWMRKDILTPKQKRQIEHRADRRKRRQSIRHWEDEEEF